MTDLDQEYSPKAAAKERARVAQRQQIENQRRALEAEPITDRDELSQEVARLASAWGLKKKGRTQ